MATRSKLSFTLSVVSTAVSVAAAPCDIYASGNTPRVAAHSTNRYLYDSYNSALYQIKRGSDNATSDINPVSAGGISGNNNHLSAAPTGGAASGPSDGGYDDLTLATGAPVPLNGQKVYRVFIQPESGYRIDNTSNIATGDSAQGIYAVVDGTHYNNRCCFDYGNAETSNDETGSAHMEALYFGLGTGYNTGAGDGPWILADLEDGLYNSDYLGQAVNSNDPTTTARFTTAILKGTANQWSICGGDTTTGRLVDYFSGPRLDGYNPMQKEGSIILGIGGNNSNEAQGTFYEGVMTSGYPSDATENAVQSDIVAAKYGETDLTSGPAVSVGSSVSFHVTTPGFIHRYLVYDSDDNSIITQAVSSSDRDVLKNQASWIVRTSLGNNGCVSFKSRYTPGSFIRHYNYALIISPDDRTQLMHEDATYCPQSGLNSQGN